jgi:hypothetical protein
MKHLLASTLLTASLAVAGPVHAQQGSSALAGVQGYGQIGIADLPGVRDGVAIKFGADFLKNLGGVKGLGITAFLSRWDGDSRGIDITGTTVAGGPTFDLVLPDTRFSLQGRVFASLSRVEVDLAPLGGGVSDTSLDLGLGIGGAFKIDERMSIRVDYDLISADRSGADILTAGIGYRF